MRVLFFGDSITYGAWDTAGGWVERLKCEAHRQTLDSAGARKLQFVNLGIGGDSSTKILKRMPREIEARYSPSWPFAFVITCGANDERSLSGEVETPLAQFERNIHDIIALAKQHTDKLLFVGPAPIGLPIVEFKGTEYSDARLMEYEQRMRQVVEAAALPYLSLRRVFIEAGAKQLYSYDHIHPSDDGHQLIADTVKHKLWELLA